MAVGACGGADNAVLEAVFFDRLKRECIVLYALPLLGLLLLLILYLNALNVFWGINTEFSKIVIAVVLDHF